MELSSYLVVEIGLRGEWNSVLEECGEQFAMIPGVPGKQEWCVDS